MIPAIMAMTIHPVNPGFFMMLFNLQRIEYNPDRKIVIKTIANQNELIKRICRLGIEYFVYFTRVIHYLHESIIDHNISLYIKIQPIRLMSLFRRKTLSSLLAQAADSEKSLKRTLGPWNLIALGIGAIIGAGLFVRTAAAAGGHAGPAVTISFIVAAVGCAFAGLCYAEFASMIPIAGSAYTYAYTTMGEIVAWIIGWDLVLEYALGAATVCISLELNYLNKLFATDSYSGVILPLTNLDPHGPYAPWHH